MGENSRGRIRQMSLYEVDNGFVVQVGCKTFVFIGETNDQRADFITRLSEYIANPDAVEKAWFAAHPPLEVPSDVPREYATAQGSPIESMVQTNRIGRIGGGLS